jgi:glutathione-regulated potassium-efflux system ancillary protein KefC
VEDFLIQIVIAFAFGLGARTIGLPPLVGFLVAGFALNAAGFGTTQELENFADLGVTLLLFSIGLKLHVKDLLRPFVWAGASLHMLLTVAVFGAILYALPFGILGELDFTTAVLIAFALSFSSTVFAVKVFEEQGQSSALHAQTAIGILIIQDLIAVIFLAASSGKPPSPWALTLAGLYPARRLLKWLMTRGGHSELLLLLGIIMAIGGYSLFDALGLKGDLGALVFGMLVADHPKAKEMAGSLLSLKDLFLVGFFLSIGLRGLPSVTDLGIAFALMVLIAIKVIFYLGILARFNLRIRTATMTSLSLANFSEFGLIVGALGVSMGWLSEQWLLIIAVAVAGTFITASPVNAQAHIIYDYLRNRLAPFESDKRLPEEEPVDTGSAEIAIFGMGRLGTGAYDAMHGEFGDRLLGVDCDLCIVQQHNQDGRHVIRGDPTDLDFWDQVIEQGNIRIAMLALPNHRANLAAATEIRSLKQGADIVVTATAKFEDQIQELSQAGVDKAFDLYSEAGQGYADIVQEFLSEKPEK